jgi:hypothetical protein
MHYRPRRESQQASGKYEEFESHSMTMTTVC